MIDTRLYPPITWIENPNARLETPSDPVSRLLPPDLPHSIRRFHRQIPGFRMSPLKALPHLAGSLGLGGIWVKDESSRINLGSFKVLGGSYAIYQLIRSRLGVGDVDTPFADLTQAAVRDRLGEITFATATDGNHGRGVAWTASQLGYRAVIYVHQLTSTERIRNLVQSGAEVVIVQGNYDDAVRQVVEDAREHCWEVISDTAWEGYEEIPKWVMQGYMTMLSEVQEQLAGQGLSGPTHILVQAGVGSLAAAALGYYHNLFGDARPQSVVVEPIQAACLFESARIGDGQPHVVTGELDTIMAGLACGVPNPLAWQILTRCADIFAICPDYVAAQGMRVYGVPLAGDPFIVSGESGAVTLGALMYMMKHGGTRLLRERLQLGPDSQVLLINSEGNTAPDDFRHIVWEGGIPVPEEYRLFHRGT
jgi:diaminopropionate ammonia-lyase